jgi:peptidyl-tRNA hydrolase
MSEFRVGDKVVIVQDTSDHGYKIGRNVVVASVSSTTLQIMNPKTGKVGHFWLHHSDVKLTSTNVTGLQEELQRLKAAVDEVEQKLAFVKETQSEEFDPEEFRVYRILTTFDGVGGTLLERAKVLAKLLKEV